MKIVHYTDRKSAKDILSKGFKKDFKVGNITKKINIALESFKPGKTKDFIKLDKSLQFLPYDSKHTPFKVMPQRINELVCLQVDVRDLDEKKLYVSNGIYVGKINDLLDKCYKSDDVEESLIKTVNSAYYKETINKYWKSFIEFKLYRVRNRNNVFLDERVITTFLYFDDIEPHIIKEVEFNKQLFLRNQT